MLKRKFGWIAAGVLTVSLAACNTGDNADNAMGNRGPGVYGTNNNQGTRGNNNGDNGIDHNGPLTEDYNKEDGDLNLFGNNRGNDNNARRADDGRGNDTAQNDNRNAGTNGNRDRDLNIFDNNGNRTNDEEEMNISSYRTSKSSQQYPHTRAVLIREAKYQFVPVGPRNGTWFQAGSPMAPAPRQDQQAAPPNQGAAPDQQATPNQEAAPNQGAAPGQQAAPEQQPAPEQQAPAKQQPAAGISKEAQQVIDLTNEQRRQNGLPPLKADAQLSGVAQKKSADMQQKGYFSHTSPTYGSPFDMMRDHGVNYRSAGENIAQGQRTPQEVVQSWMNSPGHRKNILSRDFTHIGVGYESQGNHWTQMFIGK